MFDGNQRHVDTNLLGKIARPLPATGNDDATGDGTPFCLDALDDAFLHGNAGHLRVFKDPCTGHPGTLGKRLGDIGGICLPIGRQKCSAHNIINGHQGPKILCFFRGEQLHVEPERMGGRRLPLDLCPALLVAGKPQAAIHFPARGLTGLGFQGLVELHRIAQQLGDVGA